MFKKYSCLITICLTAAKNLARSMAGQTIAKAPTVPVAPKPRPTAALIASQKGRDMYPVGKRIRLSALVALTVCGFACLSAGTALAHTWRLTGPPAFVLSQDDPFRGGIFQPGTSRKTDDKGALVTTTLNSRTANSAAFTTTHGLWGTNSISYSWDSPPEVLHTGDVVAFNIRWNIGQKFNRFSPQLGTLTHLDSSTDWYTTQCYGELCSAPRTSGQERNTVITVTSNNPTELVFYVDVHSTPGNVRVQWTYRLVEGDVPPSSGAAGGMRVVPKDGTDVEYDTDRPGSDYRGFDLPEANFELCRRACADDANCKAYTYVKPGVQGANARCYLKSPAPAGQKRNCCISGTKSSGNAPPLIASQEKTVFDSVNGSGVGNQPTAPATFTLRQPHVITSIMTYHWNDGRGTRAGTIALRDANGRTYGPWPVAGSPGQGGVPNAVWIAEPNVTLPAGEYTIIDSEPSTWSQNSASGNRGMSAVKGYPI